MKRYLPHHLLLAAIVAAGVLGIAPMPATQSVAADSAPKKIRLMAEALRARDSGNLEAAKKKAEKLIEIAPDDKNVQRLLSSINDALDQQSQGGESAYGQASDGETESSVEQEIEEQMRAKGASKGGDAEAKGALSEAAQEQTQQIEAAKEAIEKSEKLAELGAYEKAMEDLAAAEENLSLNTATADILNQLQKAKTEVVLIEARTLAKAGKPKQAKQRIEQYRDAGAESKEVRRLVEKLENQIADPGQLDIAEISPQYVEQQGNVRELVARGRAQYLNGDLEGAAQSLKEAEARDPNNAEVKRLQELIAQERGNIQGRNRPKTRQQMLTEVEENWDRPKVFDVDVTTTPEEPQDTTLVQKLNNIKIPRVNFAGMELTRVIETLSELSVEYDSEGEGVNIVPIFDPNQTNPKVNISLRNLSLDRILEFVTQQVNFSYEVGQDAVTVQPSQRQGGNAQLITEFFPISRATVIRLTGGGGDGGQGQQQGADPFAPQQGGGGGGGGGSGEQAEQLRSFFQSAGVNFDIPGASLAFDGEQIIVTQSSRNLDRMRTILRRYTEVKQVEIESKFLEVQQNDLQELGFNWNISDGAPAPNDQRQFQTQGRNLRGAFEVSQQESAITIDGDTVATNEPPDITDQLDIAQDAAALFTANGWSVGGADVDVAIRALARKTGSDLMSAPKVTVLSGKQATITVAQELRYPESFGDIESEASEGGDDGGGGSSISITAGTPRDFVTRNVGVEMSVTPNVGENDTISLLLEPQVTEFQGFVEYGGPSVAVSGDTTVTVPAGFFQPVFATRSISTEVTVFDGATLVMGGLTRDEVKSVNDSVPVLGDIPFVGRLFRSEGETRQKRNLLIFVTANLISPGGSPARQDYRTVEPNSLFQNPTITTPSGTANRRIAPEEGQQQQ